MEKYDFPIDCCKPWSPSVPVGFHSGSQHGTFGYFQVTKLNCVISATYAAILALAAAEDASALQNPESSFVLLEATTEFGKGCSIIKMQQIRILNSFTPMLYNVLLSWNPDLNSKNSLIWKCSQSLFQGRGEKHEQEDFSLVMWNQGCSWSTVAALKFTAYHYQTSC